MPCIRSGELTWIQPEDREYVAAEMTAFLLFFLNALPCPRLNRPTPGCLSGPLWSPLRWMVEAARLGIPVLRPTSEETTSKQEECRQVTMVGGEAVDGADGVLASMTLALGRAAEVEYLSATFLSVDGAPKLIGVHTLPSADSASSLEAIQAWFRCQGAA